MRNTSAKKLYMVGIGASAGGLEAITDFFDHVTASDDIAYIIVPRLSPEYKIRLVEIIRKHTYMRVLEAEHQQMVAGGNVYIIPRNKELTIKNGCLQLKKKAAGKAANTTIDIFLNSLAADQGNRAIGIVLSGTGSDGTKGIQRVKNQGGFVIVQDPATARFNGMPVSAIASGCATVLLPPSKMFGRLIDYTKGPDINNPNTAYLKDTEMQAVLTTVDTHTGKDFSQHKKTTTLRRIQHLRLKSCTEYLQHLSDNITQSQPHASGFSLRITSFFRDKPAFDQLYTDVIIPVVRFKSAYEPFRVWVTPCSTGEEAYSIAILIDKAMQQENKLLDVKIFASDIDQSAIDIAAKGKYQTRSLLGIENQILSDYFTPSENYHHIISRIRKWIVFTVHDLMKDPPFVHSDLISCRNLLNNMNPSLQKRILDTMLFSLAENGYLFLGASENIGGLAGLKEVNASCKIYQLKRSYKALPVLNRTSVTKVDKKALSLSTPKIDMLLEEDLKNVLIHQMNMAGIYVNESFEIKEGIGAFRKYLGLPEPLTTLNLLKLTPPELSGLLSEAIRKCQKEGKAQFIHNFVLKQDRTATGVNIFIHPPSENLSGTYTLVVFVSNSKKENEKTVRPGERRTVRDNYVRQLEDELQEARNNLKQAVESLEMSNEELQSNNEELQSANEELQSSNEELQSLNEELYTFNTEHQHRIQELSELHDDIPDYQQTSPIGQIFLDKSLCIRRFNQSAAKVVNVIESDIGRPISHLTHAFKDASFVTDIQQATDSAKPIEREYELKDGRICLVRLSPYLKQEKIAEGIVITFIDITAILKLNTLIKNIFETSSSPIFVFRPIKDVDGRIQDFVCTLASERAYLSFGRQVQQDQLFLRKDFAELATANALRKCKQVIETGKSQSFEISFIKNGKQQWYQTTISKVIDACVWILTDITERVEDARALQHNYNELILTREALDSLNLELERKVQARTYALQQSEERFRTIASATSDVIWDWELARDEIWWSDTFQETFGFEPDPAPFKWMKNIHPDDYEHVYQSFNTFLNQHQSVFSITYRYKKERGDYAHVLNQGTILQEEGTPYRIIGTIIDLTKLEESRQQLRETKQEVESLIHQLRLVSDFIPQIMWTVTPEGRYDFFNKRWYDYTGIPQGNFNYENWWNSVHPDDVHKTRTDWLEAFNAAEPFRGEFRIKNHEGIYHWFLATAQPMRDTKNRVTKWYVACTDIDIQKSVEYVLEEKVHQRTEQLKFINAQLQARNSELAEFASITSHDLKEPLRKIRLMCDLIQEEYPSIFSGELGDYLQKISNASLKAARMVTDILDYNRLPHQQRIGQVDLNLLVNDIVRDLDTVIQEKKAVIEVEPLPCIEGVEVRLRQLFLNLIANSLKFNKPGIPPNITISCGRLNDTQGAVAHFEIRIKDNGIGFKNDESDKIFSLFKRLNGDQYEGTGIGLSIVKKIIDEHGGKISAHGDEGWGAEFVITIPEKQIRKSAVSD